MWQDLYRLAFQYLLKLGMSYYDAQDMAQETLLCVYLHLDSIQEGKLKSYVFAAAKNKYIDFFRKNKKEFAMPDSDDFCISSFSEIQIENKEVIKKALSKLSPAEHKLFHMKYSLGMTNAEISSALKITPDSAKTMLWRLRKKLKEHLKKEEES